MEFYSMWKLAVQNVVWKHFRDSKCLSNLLWPFPMVLTRDITEKGERVPSVSLEEPAELEWQLVALVQTWLNLSQHKLMAVPETEPFSSGWHPGKAMGQTPPSFQSEWQRGGKIILITPNWIESPSFQSSWGRQSRHLIQIISQLTGQPKSSALKLNILEFLRSPSEKKKVVFWPYERDQSDFYLWLNVWTFLLHFSGLEF